MSVIGQSSIALQTTGSEVSRHLLIVKAPAVGKFPARRAPHFIDEQRLFVMREEGLGPRSMFDSPGVEQRQSATVLRRGLVSVIARRNRDSAVADRDDGNVQGEEHRDCPRPSLTARHRVASITASLFAAGRVVSSPKSRSLAASSG